MSKTYIPLLDLYLDKENPRHDPIKDQADIIQQLVKKEDVRALARHVAERGSFSPLDTLGVIKEGGRFIVVEGNRRACAGILLNDPGRSPPGDEKYFRSLVEAADYIPSQIECYVFDSREDAREWIAIRHNGPQGGVGTLTWDADQKARFFNNSGTALSLALLDYAVNGGMLSPDDRESKRLLTTAARYLNNPQFREKMGIVSGRSDPQVKINVPDEEFNRALARFCKDLLDPHSGVSSRSNRDDWIAYGQKLLDEGDAPTTRVEPHELDSSKAKVLPPKGKPKPRNNPSSDYRKTIVDNATFKVVIKDRHLKRVFDELRSVNCNDHPLAAVVVCRIFLENIYRAYKSKHISRVNEKEEVHITLQHIVQHLSGLASAGQLNKGQKSALGALKRVASNENNLLSPKTLGAFAHLGHYPEPRSIKIEWDNVSEIVLYMLNEI